MVADRIFQQGEHVCVFYETTEQQLAVSAAYVAEGLRCRERCLYVGTDAAALNDFREQLRQVDIDPDAAEATTALVMLTSANAHLAAGSFDSERMLRMLNQGIESALDAGFTGLRTCGDMTWLLDHPSAASHVMEYEALVTELFKTARGVAMCQYDRNRFAADLIDRAMATHASMIGVEDITPATK